MQSGADTARPNADDLVPGCDSGRFRTRKWRPCGARATGCPRHDRASRGRRLPCRPRSPDRTEDDCRSARFAWTRSLGADRKDPRRGGRALLASSPPPPRPLVEGEEIDPGPRHRTRSAARCSQSPSSASRFSGAAVRPTQRSGFTDSPYATRGKHVLGPDRAAHTRSSNRASGSWPRFRESPPTLPVRCSAGSGASTAYSVPVLNAGLKSTASALSGPMPSQPLCWTHRGETRHDADLGREGRVFPDVPLAAVDVPKKATPTVRNCVICSEFLKPSDELEPSTPSFHGEAAGGQQ